MSRAYYQQLARARHGVPVGTDLLLHEQENMDRVLNDGSLLGQVIAQAAERYHSPLAIPLMDLRIEKQMLAEMLNIPHNRYEIFHLDATPDKTMIDSIRRYVQNSDSPRPNATIQAVRYIAEQTDFVPIGMVIGPFSLMVKILDEPVLNVYAAATGAGGSSEDAVMLFATLEMATELILAYIDRQVDAGASAIFLCEPAANMIYISPHQLADDVNGRPDIFDRCVIHYNRVIARHLARRRVDLIFHDCGELTDTMVSRFGHELHPSVLSLGSSRRLWEDAPRVPDDVVLYGNLPSKRFYSDIETPLHMIDRMAADLTRRMAEINRPFILGTECDVLAVDGCECTISQKVMRLCRYDSPDDCKAVRNSTISQG